MKTIHIYLLTFISSLALILTSCEKADNGRIVYPFSSPEISNLSYSFSGDVEAADSIYFSIDIYDPLTPLSTLEVALVAKDNGEILHAETIRTKGNSYHAENHAIYIPFYTEFQEKEVTLQLTAINVEGSETVEEKTFLIKRPTLPATLYLHYDGNVVPMTVSETNPYLYETESGDFPEIFEGKISSSASLDDSKFIWGYAETNNHAELVAKTGANFTFYYEYNIVEKVLFNTFTFDLSFDGISTLITVNGVELEQNGSGLFVANIQFTKGEKVEVTGIDNIAAAYNRDFFVYDEETGELTFIRDSGTWEVYYSIKYNYIWIARMDDYAPDAYWIVGHGFTSASQWHSDYSYGGWELEDITRLGYAVKIGDNKYQSTIYLNDDHEWWSFEIEIYSDLWWGKDNGMLLTEGLFEGDVTGITESASNGLTNTDGFVPGYYRLTFDTSGGVGGEKVKIERIGN